MPSLTQIKQLNALHKALTPIVVSVGATAGIGQHTALKIAEHTSPRKVIISGRNAKAGQDIVSRLNKITGNTNNEFVPIDATVLKSIYNYCDEIKQKVGKINFLVLSQGIVTSGTRDESEDGIDKKMACLFYSRFVIIKELLPLLEKAAADGEEARVLSIFAPGREGQIHEDDLALKKNYGLRPSSRTCSLYNSLMVEGFSERSPNVSFSHIYPGWVDTVLKHGPWYLYYPSRILAPFAFTEEESGEMMTYALTNEKFKKGWHLISQKLEPAESKNCTKKNLELVWNHAEEVTRKRE